MKTIEKQIIAKQDELVAVLQRHLDFSNIGDFRDVHVIEGLESELTALRSQLSEPEKDCENCDEPIPCNLDCEQDSLKESGGNKTAEMPESFKTLFRCLEDSSYEINFYGNDGNDNQEKIDGKELLIKWIKEAYFDYASQFQEQQITVTDDEIETVMDNKGMTALWDRMNGRTMARWVKSEIAKRALSLKQKAQPGDEWDKLEDFNTPLDKPLEL